MQSFAIIWALLTATPDINPKNATYRKNILYCTHAVQDGLPFSRPGLYLSDITSVVYNVVLNISNVSYRMKRSQERYQGIKEVGQ